ncbi:MAG: translation initiation factor IF-6 [Thermoplasmatales archaeon]|nr:translation initiation factor IF-6 [Thermoplasmatales archaeon]
MLKRIDFNGNSYLGIYCKANNLVAFVQPFLPEKTKKEIEEILKVKTFELTIGSSTIIGSLLAINSNAIVVTDFIEKEEMEIIEDKFDGEIFILEDKFNAAGNNILANDYGAIVHPLMGEDTIKKLEKVMEVEVRKGTIAGLNTVGMLGLATNKGVLCHPKIKEEEKKLIEKVLDVEVNIGTVNHGMPFVGAGAVANRHGAIVGSATTGIEMGRIEEALHLSKNEV